ncbi:MAG: hypothetical protein AB8W78_03285 [Arsenophonus endosymbiont of Dermacentor nuttalli]
MNILLIVTTFFTATSLAETIIVPIQLVTAQDNQQIVGEIKITETKFGLLFTPQYKRISVRNTWFSYP